MESVMLQNSMFYKQPKYIIDTCSLLSQKETHIHNRKVYKALWVNIERLLIDGEIVILSEVAEEIKDGEDEVSAWLKAQEHMNLPLDKFVQDTARELLKTVPEIVDFKECKSSADIFLIAAAKKYNLTVITEENKLKLKKIPMICEKVGVKCININELCSEENWSF